MALVSVLTGIPTDDSYLRRRRVIRPRPSNSLLALVTPLANSPINDQTLIRRWRCHADALGRDCNSGRIVPF